MMDLKRNEARRRENRIENDTRTRKAGHYDTDAELEKDTDGKTDRT